MYILLASIIFRSRDAIEADIITRSARSKSTRASGAPASFTFLSSAIVSFSLFSCKRDR